MAILSVKDKDGNWIDIPAIVGPKPQRGTDYWTAEDRRAIVDDVLAALPVAEGASF